MKQSHWDHEMSSTPTQIVSAFTCCLTRDVLVTQLGAAGRRRPPFSAHAPGLQHVFAVCGSPRNGGPLPGATTSIVRPVLFFCIG